MNCLSPVVGFLRALLHLLWATMPCPAPGCITWKLGIAAARGRRLFLGCGGCLEIYGNLIYMSQSKQDLMICVLYGVQSPIKNFCHPSWRWILSPFSLWNVSFCHDQNHPRTRKMTPWLASFVARVPMAHPWHMSPWRSMSQEAPNVMWQYCCNVKFLGNDKNNENRIVWLSLSPALLPLLALPLD